MRAVSLGQPTGPGDFERWVKEAFFEIERASQDDQTTQDAAADVAAGSQPLDATLTSIAALGTAADRYLYTTGVNQWAEGIISALARNFLDEATAAGLLGVLGVTLPLPIGSGGTGQITASAALTALTTSSRLAAAGGEVISDYNNATDFGLYVGSSTATNAPVAEFCTVLTLVYSGPLGHRHQIAIGVTGFPGRTWRRDQIAGTWGSWTQVSANGGAVFHSDNLSPARLNTEDQVLTGGARVESKPLGTISSGTIDIDPGDRPMQHYVNAGAHALTMNQVGIVRLYISNGVGAGAITWTGFSLVKGDPLDTTNGSIFIAELVHISSVIRYAVIMKIN